MKKILVPVDGSDHADKAAAWAANIARETGASVTLLYVYDMPAAEAMALSHLSAAEVADAKQRQGQPSFDKARAAMGEAAAVADTIVVVGSAADEIVGLARARGFDHIAMGSRGLSPVRELLLGSVSEQVIREAPCAVTIVR